jgi:hypothetical protein
MSSQLAFQAQTSTAAFSAEFAFDADDAIYNNPSFGRGLREDVETIRRNAMAQGVPVSHLEWVDGKEFMVTLGKEGVTLSRRELVPFDFGPVAEMALEGYNRHLAKKQQL